MTCPNCQKSLWFIESFCPFCKTPFNEEGRSHLERKNAASGTERVAPVAAPEPTEAVVMADAALETPAEIEAPVIQVESSRLPTQSQQQDATMFCRNCGKQVGRQAVACPSCGVPPRSQTNFCPGCGASTTVAQKECGSCGLFLVETGRAMVAAAVVGCLLLIGFGVCKFLLNPPRRSEGTMSVTARSPSPASEPETFASSEWKASESSGLGHSQSWQQGYAEGREQGKGNTIYWWFGAPAPFVPTPNELKELARRFAIFKKVANADRTDYQEGFYQGYSDGYQEAQKPAF